MVLSASPLFQRRELSKSPGRDTLGERRVKPPDGRRGLPLGDCDHSHIVLSAPPVEPYSQKHRPMLSGAMESWGDSLAAPKTCSSTR